MKKLFSILAVFVFMLTGGILLTACCGDKEYEYHIPSQEDMEAAGIENIATSSGHITNDDKTFYFYFMERYDYDATTLTVHFLNNAGQDVAVSAFELENFDQNMNKKTYCVTLQEPQEITITLEGKARIETKTLSIEPIGDGDGEYTLTDADKANLMINLEINGVSTGDLSYEEFSAILSDEQDGDSILLPSQALDYGSTIKITLWNKNALSMFKGAVLFQGDNFEGASDWTYNTVTSNGKTILKNTVTYELVDDIKVDFILRKNNFEEAKFGTDNDLRTGFLYYQNGDHWGLPLKIVSTNDTKIETLAVLIKEHTVNLKLDASEDTPPGYIAQKVSENQYNHFAVYFNGIRLSDVTLTPENIEVTTEAQDTTKNYTIVFKNIAVNFANETKLFEDKDSHYFELFKIVWQDFQDAMDADFVKLPLNCEYDFETVGPYCGGQNSNLGTLYLSGTGSELQYVFKDQEVEYNFGFMTTDEIDGYRKSAVGKKFKISIGNESREITIPSKEEAENAEVIEFSLGQIKLTFNPQDDGEGNGTVPRIRAVGKAQAFASAGSVLKIELVA